MVCVCMRASRACASDINEKDIEKFTLCVSQIAFVLDERNTPVFVLCGMWLARRFVSASWIFADDALSAVDVKVGLAACI